MADVEYLAIMARGEGELTTMLNQRAQEGYQFVAYAVGWDHQFGGLMHCAVMQRDGR